MIVIVNCILKNSQPMISRSLFFNLNFIFELGFIKSDLILFVSCVFLVNGAKERSVTDGEGRLRAPPPYKKKDFFCSQTPVHSNQQHPWCILQV